jgi:hypothetical protein
MATTAAISEPRSTRARGRDDELLGDVAELATLAARRERRQASSLMKSSRRTQRQPQNSIVLKTCPEACHVR